MTPPLTFYVHAIPFASTENNTKLFNGIIITEASYVHSKQFNMNSQNQVKCLAIRQVTLSNKNIQIDIENDMTLFRNQLRIEIENFISILEELQIQVLISEEALDEVLLLELAKRNILCIYNVSSIERICNCFSVIPMSIHSLSRYSNELRRYELLSFGTYESNDLTSHIFTCNTIKQIPLSGQSRKALYLEPLCPLPSKTILIRAPMDSLAETYRNLFFKLLHYLTNSFKFLTQDLNAPTVATLSGGLFFESKISTILKYIRSNFPSPATHPELGYFLTLLSDTFEALSVQIMQNLLPNVQSRSRYLEIMLHLQQTESCLLSFMNVPRQEEVNDYIEEYFGEEEGSQSLQTYLLKEGLIALPHSQSNLGITESLSSKVNTLTNLCLSLKRLLTVDGFMNFK